MRFRRILALCALLAAATPLPVLAGVTPSVGYTSPTFCGTPGNHAWKLQRESDGAPQNVYSDVFSDSRVCLSGVESDASGFSISSSSVANGYGAYPNIGQGDQWGTRPRGTWLPVRVARDGNPVASVSTNSLSVHGTFNSAFDIWFNRADNPTVGQNNGAELMIWLDCHGNCIGFHPITIDGIHWLYTTWITHHNGVSWHYIAFVARHHKNRVSALHLNPFFTAAVKIGALSRSWWLTGVDYGFELVSGGAGLRVTSYSLTGVGVTTPKPPLPRKHPQPPRKHPQSRHLCWQPRSGWPHESHCQANPRHVNPER